MQKKPYSENELLLRIAAGDERAFGQLVDQWWAIVLNHTLTFLKSPSLAEETTLDIFEKIWHKREMLKSLSSFNNWLFILCKHECINHLRKKLANTEPLNSRDWCIEEAHLPGKSLELKDLANIIEEGISKLTPRQQKIFLMSRQDGLTHEQIAHKLGLSKHTVKGHLVICLNFLRQFLYEKTGMLLPFIPLLS